MSAPSRIEAFAIISADGMIADAAGHMPDALKIEADPCDHSLCQLVFGASAPMASNHFPTPRVSAAETR